MTRKNGYSRVSNPKYLTKAGEAELIHLYRSTGEIEYRNILVDSQTDWVHKLAFRFAAANRASAFVDDFIQVGMCAVIRSLDTFDSNKGRLTTYVTLPINIAMARYFLVYNEQIHPPHHLYDKKKKLEKAKQESGQLLGQEINNSELIVLLPFTENQLLDLEKAFYSKSNRSFQNTRVEDISSSRHWFAAFSESIVQPKAEEHAKESEYRRIFAAFFRDKDEEGIASELIISYLGIEDQVRKTRQQVADLFNMTLQEVDWAMRSYKKKDFKAFALEVMGIKR